MPRYLIEASYLPSGVQGIRKDGAASRRDVVAKMAESVGGRLESFDFAFGKRDVYAIVDLPDNAAAAAVALAVNGSGVVEAVTTVLLSADDVDAAIQRTVDYRPPGG